MDGPDASPQSLRAFLRRLEADGALRRVAEPVDPRFGISRRLCAEPAGPALLFERVEGSALAVVGNVLSSRARMASALGTTAAGLSARMVDAVGRALPPRLVRDAPCQAVAVDRPDLGSLPVPAFFEHETGRYVTAGAIVAKDPGTGGRNLSIARLKLLGGSRAMIGIAPNHHLAVMARGAAARGRGLELAVTVGNHPAVLLAACLYLDYGDDELGHAGTLLGEPVEVTGMLAKVSDLEIDTEDLAAAIVRLEDGTVAEVHVDYLQRHAQARIEVIGSEGAIVWDATGVGWRRAGDTDWTVERVPFDVNEMYVAELSEFADCLATGRRPALDGAEGRTTLALALAVRRSAELGTHVRFEAGGLA